MRSEVYVKERPEDCPKCSAKATPRRVCPRCGDPEWVYSHGEHYLGGGVREVITCPCPSAHSARGKRLAKVEAYLKEREMAWKEGKNLGGRPPKNRPVTTPAMAKRAAENLASGMKIQPALRDAGFPAGTCKNGRKSINKIGRAHV